MRDAIVVLVAGVLGVFACGTPGAPPANAASHMLAMPAPATCTEGAELEERLVIDWSPLDRSKLESAARKGLVTVRLDGCRARIVDGCVGRRRYVYAPTTRQHEFVLLRDADEVSAKLPFGAARFTARMERSSALTVAMTVVGRYESPLLAVSSRDVDGECEGATHVIANLSVGSFEISAMGAAKLAGGVDAFVGGVSGSSDAERKHLDHAGTFERCAEARRTDEAPPDDCGIPLRVELRKLGARATTPSDRILAPPPAAPPPEALRHATSMTRREVAPCYRQTLAQNGAFHGNLTLIITVGTDGKVKNAAAKHDVPDALAACAIARVSTIPFGETDDPRPRVFVIPIEFKGRAENAQR